MDTLMALLSFISQAIAGNQIMSNSQDAFDQRMKAAQIGSDPQALAKFIAGLTQPLNQGLISNVGDAVKAQTAGMGLSQSPMLYYALAKGISPLEMQEQQLGAQSAFNGLGLSNLLPVAYPSAVA